jgi:hypothetical protein
LFDIDNVYPFSIYPFDSALENDPVPRLQDHEAVEIENGILRVTVLPSLGGRIYQIEDLSTGGLYLHENRCVRPTRVPPRWNFISLGIEHNFPYAHAATGNEPVGWEFLSKGDAAGVAVGCREPQWGLCWRTEVWLHPGFRGVVVSTRCWNDTDTARDVQWWSNCAQPGASDTEFVYPGEPYEAHIDGQGSGVWPMFHGIDLRWHKNYNRMMFKRAKENPGEDFYSALNAAEIDGRLLTDEEKEGFAYLAFAGGRDTIIHTMTGIIAYFAKNPEDMVYLREHPEAVNTAAEEFFRLAIPLTHIGRVCPAGSDVHGFEVQPQGRISLTWAAANRDPEVFQNPNEVDLERKPNPHIAFGFGHHNCLGAHHARAIMRSFLTQFPRMVSKVEVLEEETCMEVEKDYTRQIGFSKLVVACREIAAK